MNKSANKKGCNLSFSPVFVSAGGTQVIYIYIYIEREREIMCVYNYIYIYICRERESERERDIILYHTVSIHYYMLATYSNKCVRSHAASWRRRGRRPARPPPSWPPRRPPAGAPRVPRGRDAATFLLLRSSLLRFVDSDFPGNPLWAWEFHPLKVRLARGVAILCGARSTRKEAPTRDFWVK